MCALPSTLRSLIIRQTRSRVGANNNMAGSHRGQAPSLSIKVTSSMAQSRTRWHERWQWWIHARPWVTEGHLQCTSWTGPRDRNHIIMHHHSNKDSSKATCGLMSNTPQQCTHTRCRVDANGPSEWLNCFLHNGSYIFTNIYIRIVSIVLFTFLRCLFCAVAHLYLACTPYSALWWLLLLL